jgi:hypothetical protein
MMTPQKIEQRLAQERTRLEAHGFSTAFISGVLAGIKDRLESGRALTWNAKNGGNADKPTSLPAKGASGLDRPANDEGVALAVLELVEAAQGTKPAQIGRRDRDFDAIVERWMELGQAATIRWTPEPDDDH